MAPTMTDPADGIPDLWGERGSKMTNSFPYSSKQRSAVSFAAVVQL